MAKAEHKPQKTVQLVVDEPVYAEDAVDSSHDLGTVQIHNSVIAGIARLAALGVPGVSELSTGFVEGLAEAFGTRKSAERGIRVEVDGEFVTIEVHVIMEYGVRIPHVAWQVQNEVRRAVEQMSGKTVNNVKVLVQGVKLPSNKPVSKPEGSAP